MYGLHCHTLKNNHQGYLTRAAGVPVNGTVEILFSIYDVPAAGVPRF